MVSSYLVIGVTVKMSLRQDIGRLGGVESVAFCDYRGEVFRASSTEVGESDFRP
jgi:hypothetical protein